MNKNDVFNVKCEGLSYEGLGVCKIDNRVVFVQNLLPEEESKIEIVDVKKSFAFGKVLECSNVSSKREEPKCKVYFECGGCDLSHMNSELKTSVKYDGVVNNLRKQGVESEIVNCIENTDIYGYRSKVVMHASNKDGEVVVGPYKKGSYEVVSNECMMLDKEGINLHNDVVELINLHKIDAYDYKTRKGLLRSVVYRKNDLNEYMIILVVGKYTKRIENIVEKLSTNNLVKSIVVNVNKGKRHHLLGNENQFVYGNKTLEFTIDDVKLNVSPGSFFQVNTDVMKKMYQVIKENVNKDEVVLDAYSGVGSITLSLADKVKEVVGIELSKTSFDNAEENKEINEITNATFINGDVAKEVVKLDYKFDTIITDPPRNGCSKEFIDFIIASKFKKIIYMSCNSATLARDIKMLSDDYEVEKVYVYDMFAHTSHAETITVLNKK